MKKDEKMGKLDEGVYMSDAEYKQMCRYLYPLMKEGYNKEYFSKMNRLEKIDLTKDWVFVSRQECHKELFIAVLMLLKTAPAYKIIDSYELRDIDNGKLKNRGYESIYDLVKFDVLFIKCGVSDGNLSKGIKEYIGHCIDPLVDARRNQGKRTFIFNYGTMRNFLIFSSRLMKDFENIALDGGEQ